MHRCQLVVAGFCCLVCGCAAGVMDSAQSRSTLQFLTGPDAADSDPRREDFQADDPVQAPVRTERRAFERAFEQAQFEGEEYGQVEVVPAPRAVPASPYKAAAEDPKTDRFARCLTDIEVDIRPTEGKVPDDLAAQRLDHQEEPEYYDSQDTPGPLCAWTPWTICYRPLYFEEINLERYGCTCGIFQPAVSGAKFFGTVAALPYKMRVRPPRSCVCSNGFSRCGDKPLPGYGDWIWRWDAAIVEAAAVTAFVFILP